MHIFTNKDFKVLLCFFTLLSALYCKSQEGSFNLLGNLSFPNDTLRKLQIIDRNSIKINNLLSIITDSTGKFTVSGELSESTMAFTRLPDGTPLDIFLEPGSKIAFEYSAGNIVFSDSNDLHNLLIGFYQDYYSVPRNQTSISSLNDVLDSLLYEQFRKLEEVSFEKSDRFVKTVKYILLSLNYSKRLEFLGIHRYCRLSVRSSIFS